MATAKHFYLGMTSRRTICFGMPLAEQFVLEWVFEAKTIFAGNLLHFSKLAPDLVYGAVTPRARHSRNGNVRENVWNGFGTGVPVTPFHEKNICKFRKTTM